MKKLRILCIALFVLSQLTWSQSTYASVVEVTEPSPFILLILGVIALGVSRKVQKINNED